VWLGGRAQRLLNRSSNLLTHCPMILVIFVPLLPFS
jgi:hypothetical protein